MDLPGYMGIAAGAYLAIDAHTGILTQFEKTYWTWEIKAKNITRKKAEEELKNGGEGTIGPLSYLATRYFRKEVGRALEDNL